MPPLAYLPEVLQRLDEVNLLLERSLEPSRAFRGVRSDQQNNLRLAVGLHTLNALEASKALHVLANRKMGVAMYPHARTMFEVLVKIRWMQKCPSRATDYLDSEPFERYALASPIVKARPVFKEVVADCKKALEDNPRLLKLPKLVGKNGHPDFAKIAKALRMPDLDKMVVDVGLDSDDYMLDFGITSLAPHSSIVHTIDFAKRINPDGSAMFSAEIPPKMLLGYAARALPRAGQILESTLKTFPDGKIEYEAEHHAQIVKTLVLKLKGEFITGD